MGQIIEIENGNTYYCLTNFKEVQWGTPNYEEFVEKCKRYGLPIRIDKI